jgi:hypothetical protein
MAHQQKIQNFPNAGKFGQKFFRQKFLDDQRNRHPVVFLRHQNYINRRKMEKKVQQKNSSKIGGNF